jgi:uncharacterized repeat protein (TIGR03803 family)
MKRIVNALGQLNWSNRACAVFVLCATTAIALPAQTFTRLVTFDGTDGLQPDTGLVQATDGNLYGATFNGGAYANNGTVFKITPSGTLTTIYSFCSQSGCLDGSGVIYAALVQATNGDFYGTTFLHGANGQGTVFKMTPGGALTTLYNFCPQGGCTGVLYPSGLIQATNGNLYGATSGSGADGSYGTVFKITPGGGTLTTIYSFCSQTGCPDGESPYGGLVQATNGDFYGVTDLGGANNQGTVFKITLSGALTTLYSFCSQTGCTDGSNANALVQATDGDFYGTTYSGGANNQGTIFKITPSGALTTLYSFCSQTGCTDGQNPVAGLVQATNGKFYGTTPIGGTLGEGTVFSLSVGLGPFVETRPTSGMVGEVVKILGTDLTNATSVSFNGAGAVFEVVSSSEITATVPTGATTGRVQVITPRGTLTSNVPFRVLP